MQMLALAAAVATVAWLARRTWRELVDDEHLADVDDTPLAAVARLYDQEGDRG